MPPRKKPSCSSSSKKPNLNNQAQPSKFGIQHFFERHTQNALLASQKQPKNDENSIGPTSAPQDSKSVASPSSRSIPCVTGSEAVAPKKLDSVIPRAGNDLNPEVAGPKIANSELQNAKDYPPLPANESNELSHNIPSEKSGIPGFNAAENLPELSPEISKAMPHKRFKFSPGMVVT